jgi:phage repressor protein C with HTH and peptisase S24 domain
MEEDSLEEMAPDPDRQRRALAHFLTVHRISARKLSLAAGLSPSVVSQFLSKNIESLREVTFQALANGASKLLKRKVTPGELRGDPTNLDTIAARPTRAGNVRPTDADVTLPLRTEMVRDLPILGSVSGGPGGLGQMNDGTAVDFALRPARLTGRTDVAGFWVEDLSMVPAYKQGALVIVERRRPPSIGDDIVFELLPETPRDERRGMIKRLVALTATTVKVEQFNPPKVLEFPRRRVENLMRVIPLAELFGV